MYVLQTRTPTNNAIILIPRTKVSNYPLIIQIEQLNIRMQLKQTYPLDVTLEEGRYDSGT
jgi:hypothetical protein